MRLLALLFFAFSGTTFLLGQSPRRSPLGKDYALLIYNFDFEKSDWLPLLEVQKEMDSLRAELRTRYGFEVAELKNLKKAELLAELEKALNSPKFQPGDQLFVYFSSHGYAQKSGKKSSGLVCRDSKSTAEDLAETTLLPFAQLEAMLEKSRCRNLLVAIDACHSGGFGKQMKNENELPRPLDCEDKIRETFSSKTRQFLTSTGEGDRSPGKSIFFARLRDRLREADESGIISVHEIYAKLHGSIYPPPLAGVFGSNIEGSDFIFVRNQACTPEGEKGAAPCADLPELEPTDFSRAKIFQTVATARGAEFFAVAPRIEGGFAAFGKAQKIDGSHAPDLGDGGGDDLFFALFDPKGEVKKAATLGGKGDEKAFAGLQTLDGNFVLAGFSDSKSGDEKGQKDAFLIKIDAQGRRLWQVREGDRGDDFFRKIAQGSDGSLVAVGSRGGHPLIVRIAPDGTWKTLAEPQIVAGGAGGNLAELTTVVIGPLGEALIGGQTERGPFLFRFGLEDGPFGLREGEVFGNVLFLEKECPRGSFVGLAWDGGATIRAICQFHSPKKQGEGRLFFIREANGRLEIPASQPPETVGGGANDFVFGACADALDHVFLSGHGHSYKRQGSPLERAFLAEIEPSGQSVFFEKAGETTEKSALAWLGDPKSHANAVAMLARRRLVEVGSDGDGRADFRIFDLAPRPNRALAAEPEIILDPQSIQLFEPKNSDGRLAAGESGWARLTIQNFCRYADGVRVDIFSKEGSRLRFPPSLWLADMAAEGSQTVALPLTALGSARAGEQTTLSLRLFVDGQKAPQPPVEFTVWH